MITIELTEKDAASFKLFREHQSNIEILVASGVFDMRRCSVELHFDNEGKIGAIVGHPLLYKRDQLVVVGTG